MARAAASAAVDRVTPRHGRGLAPPTTQDVPLEIRLAWPKLSRDLPHERSPLVCQSCGIPAAEAREDDLDRWYEHDEHDRPTKTIVVLCRRCSDRIIKPHPRLYSSIWPLTPIPGAVPFCVGCAFRDGTRCTHPNAKANGGPGVMMTVAAPTQAHLNYGGGRGEFRQMWRAWPTACRERQTAIDSGATPADTVAGA
jgi:hypothetical protein